jgi:DNA methyltransferase 1-associated protein 1
MSDVRDILGAPPQGDSSVSAIDTLLAGRRPTRRAAEEVDKARGPQGMERELFNLVGRVPIVPATAYSQEKAALSRDRPAQRWVWSPFTNPARKDGLKLHHWTRAGEEQAPYAFARLNKAVKVPNLTREDWPTIADDAWSYDETKVGSWGYGLCFDRGVGGLFSPRGLHLSPRRGLELSFLAYFFPCSAVHKQLLFELCRHFDLRFIVVHDRYNMRVRAVNQHQNQPSSSHPPRQFRTRSVEDLKDRWDYITGPRGIGVRLMF